MIAVPARFRNRKISIVIFDLDDDRARDRGGVKTLKFRIDRRTKDVVPFSDITDTVAFARELRRRFYR
ncbi:MAG: hypothetical protein AB1714_23760 [Acidobacteriota bacterium]